ncbi:protein phosphatase 1H-like isoform X2 [Entelurus aequoreus]|uniref:protein phosphatase 1H-like isoform X2 n=1 Tax=Entelurus aequoreus TaxID=161455 RepID=UPI002B1DC173|nr:protein phosphatase 1H-like isoform X2 [Entelurus aequoreus]
MLTRVKSAVATFVGGVMPGGGGGGVDSRGPSEKFPYSRPEFLGLSPDEVESSADHRVRPIVIMKESKRLPWFTGYAEVINSGKSTLNEDQACCEVLAVKRRSSLPNGEGLALMEDLANTDNLTFHYWALFDGHAGWGAAVVASRLLHHHIALHLQEVIDILCAPDLQPPTCLSEEPARTYLTPTSQRALTRAVSLRGAAGAPASPSVPPTRFFAEKKVSQESLMVGAIESAFKDMDAQIEKERAVNNISGGCTALVVVYLLGKIYVGNAGDSRAVIIRGGEVIPMSREFTPESERQRLQFLAFMQPHLLGNEFTHLEFPRRVQKKDVGKRMLYRDFTMSGWAYKTIQDDDLKFPLIYGEGIKARVLATIAVTRGLGDHSLRVYDSDIFIKPFLSCCPEVQVYPLTQYQHGADDVLVLGTDGLWDVLSNQEVAESVTCFLANCDPDDPYRRNRQAHNPPLLPCVCCVSGSKHFVGAERFP